MNAKWAPNYTCMHDAIRFETSEQIRALSILENHAVREAVVSNGIADQALGVSNHGASLQFSWLPQLIAQQYPPSAPKSWCHRI